MSHVVRLLTITILWLLTVGMEGYASPALAAEDFWTMGSLLPRVQVRELRVSRITQLLQQRASWGAATQILVWCAPRPAFRAGRSSGWAQPQASRLSGSELAGNPPRAAGALSRVPVAKLHPAGVAVVSGTPGLRRAFKCHGKNWPSLKAVPPMKASCPGSSRESFWNYFSFALGITKYIKCTGKISPYVKDPWVWRTLGWNLWGPPTQNHVPSGLQPSRAVRRWGLLTVFIVNLHFLAHKWEGGDEIEHPWLRHCVEETSI